MNINKRDRPRCDRLDGDDFSGAMTLRLFSFLRPQRIVKSLDIAGFTCFFSYGSMSFAR
ncbi:MAG: hypothetical protein KME12_24900 [Trichocoleus desertorum ATA4-8-CV12]|nr:hypothetical protein [Trichocoleus desertorum ATA4-8-CV12]